MKNFVFIFCLLLSSITFGQHAADGKCTLRPTNKAWMTKFKTVDDKQVQLELVLSKIYQDADYFEENPEITNLDDRSTFGTIPCTEKCSIRFGILYEKNKGVLIDLHKNPELEDLVLEFSPENIAKIELNQQYARDIYGHSAKKRSGIVLYTSNKALKKKIKKAIKNLRKSS